MSTPQLPPNDDFTYQLKYSVRDAVTAHYNSRHFREVLSIETARAQRYKVPLSLILGDLHKFKRVNDTFGHITGDKVLKSVAELIRASLRRTDFVFRIGGA